MPATLEFSIIFPAPPEVFYFLISLMIVLIIYWVVKWAVSIYTGAGGG
jgi:hypothetical protein